MQNFNLICPTCLNDELVSTEILPTETGLVCENCGGVYPIVHSCPQMLDLRQLLRMDENYLGAWHISQLNSLDLYKNQDQGSIASLNRDDVQQVIALMDLRGKEVLDIGSGVFCEPEYVTKSGAAKIISLDPLIPQAKPEFNLVGGIAEFLPFKNESFDAITVITSLDHVFDIPNTLKEFSRILKPHGKIYFWGEFCNNPELYGKKYVYQLLPRMPLNIDGTKKDYIENYHITRKKYQDKLTHFELNKSKYSSLLVDQFHLRHFNRDALVEDFNKAGFLVSQVEAVWYQKSFTDYIVFSKINNNDFSSQIIPVKNTPAKTDEAKDSDLEKKVDIIFQAIGDINNFVKKADSFMSGWSFLGVIGIAKRCIRYALRRTKQVIAVLKIIKDLIIDIFPALFKPAAKIHDFAEKRILMLTISQIEIDPRINKVAQSLAEKGYKVFIFSLQSKSEMPDISEEEVFPGVTYVRIKMLGLHSSVWMYYQPNYKRAAKKYNFNFVHANDLTTLATAWVIARNTGCPLIYDSHEMWSDNVIWKNGKYVRMSRMKRAIARFAEKKILQHVDSFYSVSPSILNEYEKSFKRRPLLLANFPSVRDLDNPDIDLPSVRTLCGLKHDHFATIYLGGLGPSRNIEKVIEAHQYLDDNYVFIIRGPWSEVFGAQYKALAEALNIKDRIFILPAVGRTETVKGMKGADCGIVMLENLCRNFYWFYPNKFFEYSLAGLPVAVSNFPDVSAHVEKEKMGVTFDPSDPKSIASALRSLGENRVESRAMGRRGRESILQTYNWENAMQIMTKEYEKLSGIS